MSIAGYIRALMDALWNWWKAKQVTCTYNFLTEGSKATLTL